MPYLCFLFFTVLYSFGIREYNLTRYKPALIATVPILLGWVFLIGLQYGVGTDYFTYLSFFNGDINEYSDLQGEWLFNPFIHACNSIGIYGQGIFVLISAFWFISLVYIIKETVPSKQIYLFFFVFITFSTIFHNQMNGVRQYIAIYLYSLAFICYLQKKYKLAIVFAIIMSGFHTSSLLVMLTIPLFAYVSQHYANRTLMFFAVIFALVVSFTINMEAIFNLLIEYDLYANYVRGDAIEEKTFANTITKYIHLPIVFYSIYLFPKLELGKKEKQLFCLSVLLYAFKLLLIRYAIIYRLGSYSEILMCLFLVYTLSYLKDKNKALFITFLLYFLVFYGLKVTYFASSEYLYESYFFKLCV